MKKLYFSALYLILILCFLFLYLVNTPKISLIKMPSRAEIYLENGSFGKIKSVEQKTALYSLNKKGEAYYYDEVLSVDEILDFYDAKSVLFEEINGGISVYAYSKKIKYAKTIKNERVNLHVYVNKNTQTTKIGFPIIYGSY